LPDDPARRRAQRNAHGDLTLAGRCFGEKQIGDVGAGDEQDHPDRHQQGQDVGSRIAEERLLQGLESPRSTVL